MSGGRHDAPGAATSEVSPEIPEDVASKGTLYLVATPIGNLGDATPRMIEVLSTVDRVLAEDTRRTRRLMTHFGIDGRPVDRFDAHAEVSTTERVVATLLQGQNLALVSDAGIPTISDPGARLIAAARRADISIVPIPGACAVTTAVAAAGVSSGFWFTGFFARKGTARAQQLARVAEFNDAVVFFESPARLGKTLVDLAAIAPSRTVTLAREMTKIHEEFVSGTLQQLADRYAQESVRGECTVVLHPCVAEVRVADGAEVDALIATLDGEGLRAKAIARSVAERVMGWSVRDVYERIHAPAEVGDENG